MSFLNKAREQAQKTMGGAAVNTPAIPKVKPGIPKPPTGKPGLPPKPGIKPSVPGAKEKTPLEAKANPFLKKTETKIEEKIEKESIEKDPALTAPLSNLKEEKKELEKIPEVAEEIPTPEAQEEAPKEEIKEEEKETKNIEEEKKEEPKETKKKTSSKKKTSKNKESNENKSNESIAPKEIPATEIDYAEAMVSIKSNFVDQEWETFREEIITQLNEINISSDMTPSALKETIANLSALKESIWVQYNDTKTAFEKLTAKEPEGLIERIKKLNASGSNSEERKINSILAVMNYKDGAGRNINLFELLDETRERYNFLKSVMDSTQYKTNVLITMLGSLKLEK